MTDCSSARARAHASWSLIEAPLAFVTLVQKSMPRGDDAVEFDAASKFELISEMGMAWAVLCLALTLLFGEDAKAAALVVRAAPRPRSRRWQ